MNRSTTITVLAALILGLIINSVFIVNDKEHAIVFQFGEAINPNVDKGLNFKIPIIQNVKKYDVFVDSGHSYQSYLLRNSGCFGQYPN